MMDSEKKRYIILAALLMVAVVVFISFDAVYAKYIFHSQNDQNAVTADNFYFTVDILGNSNDPSKASKEIPIYSGGKTIPFAVQNYFDSQRVNEDDITYTVSYTTTVASGVVLSQNGTPVTSSAVTLAGGTTVQNQYELYIPADYQDNDEIEVTVVSSEPYKKTMTLTFKLCTYTADIEYYVEDSANAPYAELIILANVNIAPDKIIVKWNDINATGNILQVDCTDPHVLDQDQTLTKNNPKTDADTNDYLSEICLTGALDALESTSIYFLKTNNAKNYSMSRCSAVKNTDGTYTITITE